MLTSVLNNIDLNVVANITNQDQSSDTDFYYQNLLNKAVDKTINAIFDSEIYNFKPKSNTINLFTYFLSFKNMDLNPDIVKNIEPAFSTYLSSAKSILDTNITILNPYEIKQDNNNLAPLTPLDANLTPQQINITRPYLVTNPIEEFIKIKPLQSGLPLFYDSFTFPFSQKIETWKNDINGFSKSAFLYNSFLTMEFYTTPIPTTQKRIMFIPIFVNDRYMYHEQSVNGIYQARPSFSLIDGVEGFSINFLNSYTTQSFYVKFSFWDALSGNKIPLIPSSIHSPQKKGVQSQTTFNHKNEYLNYMFNYNNKTYGIYEYNEAIGDYIIEAYDIDLYQLYYDDYWAGKLVPNTRPINLNEPIITTVDNTRIFKPSVNKTNIQIPDTNQLLYLDNDQINNYFSQISDFDYDVNIANRSIGKHIVINDDKTSGFIKTTLKNNLVNNQSCISIKKMFPFTNKIISYQNVGETTIDVNCYEHLIDSIKITNNGTSDSFYINKLSLSNCTINHNPLQYLDNYQLPGNTQQIVFNDNNVYSIDKYNKKRIIAESYITYSDIYTTKNNLFSDQFTAFISDDSLINTYREDSSVLNGLADYINKNYYKSYDENYNWVYYVIPNGQTLQNLIDDAIQNATINNDAYNNNNIFNIDLTDLDDLNRLFDYYLSSDKMLQKLFFLVYGGDNIIGYSDYILNKFKTNFPGSVNLTQHLSNDIDFTSLNTNYSNSDLTKYYEFEYRNSGITTGSTLQGLTNYIQNNIVKDTNNYSVQSEIGNLRTFMLGITAEYEFENTTSIKPNDSIDINLNFFLGEFAAYFIYNPYNEITITANLNLELKDSAKNKMEYSIPINYTLKLS